MPDSPAKSSLSKDCGLTDKGAHPLRLAAGEGRLVTNLIFFRGCAYKGLTREYKAWQKLP